MTNSFEIVALEMEVEACEKEISGGDFRKGVSKILSLAASLQDLLKTELSPDAKNDILNLLGTLNKLLLDASTKLQLSEPKSISKLGDADDAGILEKLVVGPDDGLHFEDLVGLEEAKLALLEAAVMPTAIRDFIPTDYAWTGVLIFGGSGCGKSKLLKALVNTIKNRMDLPITFVEISLSDVMGNLYGDTERNLSAIFDACSKKHPCVVMMDEVDSLAGNREKSIHETEKKLINHFLSVLDGIHRREPVVFIGTTNKPFDLDTAFLRRFPKKVYIELPNKPERANILKALINNLQGNVADIDFEDLAVRTWRFSAADLTGVICAALHLVRSRSAAKRLLNRLETAEDKVDLHGLVTVESFKLIGMAELNTALSCTGASNTEKQITELESFVRNHCPRPLNLDQIRSECDAFSMIKFLQQPWVTFWQMFDTSVEFLCEGC